MEFQLSQTELTSNFTTLYQAIDDYRLSENTKSSYKSDFDDFKSYAGYIMPHSTEDVAKYLYGLIGIGRKWNTIARRAAAIDHYHSEAGFDSPVNRKNLKGLKNFVRDNNINQLLPKQAKPIYKTDLIKVTKALHELNTIKSIRDKAIIILGWAGSMRVSEIAAIRRSHLQKTPEGYVLNIYQAKNMKAGEIQQKLFPYSSDINLCPVRALDSLLEHSDNMQGFIFTMFRKGDKPTSRPISRAAIQALIVELFGSDYSAHSLRAGFISQAIEMGIPIPDIMRQSNHKSVSSMLLYDRNAVTRANAVSKVL